MTGALGGVPAGTHMDGSYIAHDLESGDTLVRVYDHTAAARGKYGACSWNPRRPPIHLTAPDAGRFDLLPTDPEPGGFLYCADSGAGEQVAIVETFRSLTVRMASLKNRRTLSRGLRDARSIRYFEVLEPVHLVDIREQQAREVFQMEEEVSYSANRPLTREWANFIKTEAIDACGIAYNSTQATSRLGQASYVLWETRMPVSTFKMDREVRLSSAEGRKLVNEALESYRVLFVP